MPKKVKTPIIKFYLATVKGWLQKIVKIAALMYMYH